MDQFSGGRSDGLTFVRQANVQLSGVRWLGAALVNGSRMRFYGKSDRGLWSSSCTDGQS